MIEDQQIVPLSDNVLANLSVEELEQRLEMQLLQMPEGQFCFVNYCGVEGVCGVDDVCGTKDVCGVNEPCGAHDPNPCGAHSS